MTDQERAALAWLEEAHTHSASNINAQWRAILKSMLAQPRLPEEPHGAAIADAISHLGHGVTDGDRNIAREAIRLYHNHLYRRLTRPKTKMVEVWRVEYSIKRSDGEWAAHSHNCDTWRHAEQSAENLRANAACIKVTGPHQQEIPA